MFQDIDHTYSNLGEADIDEAGDENGDGHAALRSLKEDERVLQDARLSGEPGSSNVYLSDPAWQF